MEQEPKIKNLYQKLLAIQQRIIGLGRNKDGHNYKYVTGEKVLEHLKPLMNEYGILLKQEVLEIENERQDYATKYGSSSEILTKVMMRFTWIDCETGETDVNLFGANGQNAWDKGVGSALTYGERYFLLKYFHISTDEDDIDNPELRAQQEAEAKKLLDNAIKEVKACKDKECTVQVWNKYPNLKEVEQFKTAVAEKGKSFEQPKNEPEPEVKWASEKQKDLIRNLVKSHHISEEYRQSVQEIESNYEGEFPLSEFERVFAELQELIKKGLEYEKNTPATAELIEEIEIHWDKPYFTPEERSKGLESLKKGYSIAKARATIATLEAKIAERSKQKVS